MCCKCICDYSVEHMQSPIRNHQEKNERTLDESREYPQNILRGSGVVEDDTRRCRVYECHGGNVGMEGGADPSEYVLGRIRGSASLFFSRCCGELRMFHASRAPSVPPPPADPLVPVVPISRSPRRIRARRRRGRRGGALDVRRRHSLSVRSRGDHRDGDRGGHHRVVRRGARRARSARRARRGGRLVLPRRRGGGGRGLRREGAREGGLEREPRGRIRGGARRPHAGRARLARRGLPDAAPADRRRAGCERREGIYHRPGRRRRAGARAGRS